MYNYREDFFYICTRYNMYLIDILIYYGSFDSELNDG